MSNWHNKHSPCRRDLRTNVGKANPLALFCWASSPYRPWRRGPSSRWARDLPMCALLKTTSIDQLAVARLSRWYDFTTLANITSLCTHYKTTWDYNMYGKYDSRQGCSNGGKTRTLSGQRILTLDMAQADRELRELRNLLEDLLSDEVHAPVLRPQVQLPLKPRGADLNSSVRGHV